MTTDICGLAGPGRWPDVGNAEVPCCDGAAFADPSHCTCWEPVYDVEQLPPRVDLAPGMRSEMCVDCAYRPGSPERAGDPDAAADYEKLRALAETGAVFWCHQGIRRPAAYRHPYGATVPSPPLHYTPPIVDGVPYRADGTPAETCAGWTALRLKALWRQQAQTADRPSDEPTRGKEVRTA